MYIIAQTYIMKPAEAVVIKTFNSLWRAKLYKWIHYDWGADPAWQGSFSWKIIKIGN
jgi:hypothetical protein